MPPSAGLPPSRLVDTRFVTTGALCVQRAPGLLSTVVGSCVSIFLWSALHRVGGVNHYLLPRTPPDRPPSASEGEFAISRLIEMLAGAGVSPRTLVAKVFGGASSGRTRWNVGAENILVAWEQLARARIPVAASDVGGRRGRRLTFDLDRGTVQARYISGPAPEGAEP